MRDTLYINKKLMSEHSLSPLEFQKLKQRVNSSVVDIFQKQTSQNRDRSPMIRICEKLNEYRTQHKIRISKDKIKSIEQLLMIKLKSKKAHEQRVGNMDQYIQFTFNPFVVNSDQVPIHRKKSERYPVSIFQGIEKKKQSLKKANIQLRMNQISSNFYKRQIIPREPPEFKQYSPLPAPTHKHHTARSNNSRDMLFLDSLLSIQKPDFNLFTKKPVNLFKFWKNQSHPDFRSRIEILSSQYFCQNSVITTTQPAHQFIRHLSLIGRRMALNQTKGMSNEDLLSQNHIFVNLEKLGFQEIMFVSSGQLGWQVLYKFLSGYTNVGDENIQLLSEYHRKINTGLQLSADQHNVSTVQNDSKAVELIQKNGYLNFELTKKQKNQQEFSVEQKQKFQQITKIQNMLKCYNIKDIRLLEQIQRIKTEIKSMQITTVNQDNKMSIQKKILLQKKLKNRQTRIKNTIAAQAFRAHKSTEINAKKKKKRQNFRADISNSIYISPTKRYKHSGEDESRSLSNKSKKKVRDLNQMRSSSNNSQRKERSPQRNIKHEAGKK